ncbi:MAG: two-component sensor histidine kinase, partial [Comamonas sp.]
MTPGIPHLGKRLSRSLALQTMLGLGFVCLAVYWVTAIMLTQRQQDSLLHKQQAVEHLLQEGRAAHTPDMLMHMLDDFLTGHDELSLRITDASGQLLFEKLRQPLNDPRSERLSFSVELPGVLSRAPSQAAQSVQVALMLDKHPDDAMLRKLAWTLGLASIVGALLVSLFSTWL